MQPDQAPAVPLQELQRVTTEYVDTEDRMRLTCATAQGGVVVLWMTQRFLQRLLPHLTKWLESNGSVPSAAPPDNSSPQSSAMERVLDSQSQMMQGFAQQAAMADLAPTAPVAAAQAAFLGLVEKVELRLSAPEAEQEGAATLVFKAMACGATAAGTAAPSEEPGDGYFIAMQAHALRQWLGILYGQYRVAAWPEHEWPEWLRAPEALEVHASPATVLH